MFRRQSLVIASALSLSTLLCACPGKSEAAEQEQQQQATEENAPEAAQETQGAAARNEEHNDAPAPAEADG